MITIPLLLIATILTIFFGRRYAAHQQEEMDNNQLLIVEEATDDETEADQSSQDNETETDSLSHSIEEYESRIDSLSLYETLDYLSLTNEDVTVAYYGDIDAEAEWVSLVNNYLNTAVSGNLTISDFTYPQEDTYELYIQQTTQSLTSENPDVIFYGLPALPDKIRDIGLAETEQYMTALVSQLNDLDTTELILIEPYPIVNEINQLNSRSLDYRSYLGRMQQVASELAVPIIPLHDEFTSRTEESGLEAFYTEDNTQLNQEGVELVVTILDEWFQQDL